MLRLVTEVAITSPWLLAVIVGLAAVDALLPVVPSEALILAAGVAAAAGQQDLLLVIGAAGLGAFLGEVAGYGIGRAAGPSVRGRLRAGSPRQAAYDRVAGLLARRGGTVLLTARFVPAGRTAATLAAGATGYPGRRFLGFTLVGAWLSAAWVAVLGYLGGTAFAGNTLLALAVSFTLATVIGLGVEGVRRLSAGRHRDAREPGGAVGEDVGDLPGLHVPVGVGGARGEHAGARGQVDGRAPHPPRVAADLGGQLGVGPRAAVHAHLDPGDAPRLRPRHARDDDATRGHRAGAGRGVDPRHRLDRAPLAPAAVAPVGPVRGERGDLQVGHPLRRRHVAVQARHDHAHRETVLRR
jgi:membrane protein DedA with SNARE-associated domain